MNEINQVNYNLVAQKALGDYEVVDINRLGYNLNVSNKLSEIDRFTSGHTLDDLTKLIEQSNMISKDYLAGELRVVSNNKQNHSIMTREVVENLQEFKNSKDIIYLNTKDILRGKFNDDIDKRFNDDILNNYIKKLQRSFQGTLMQNIKAVNNDDKKLFLKNLFSEFLKKDNRLAVCIMIRELPYEMERKLIFVINHDIVMRQKMDTARNLKKGNEI